MEKNKREKLFFPYILKNRKQMLQFYLLKFLKFEDLINLKQTSKDSGLMCDTNYFIKNSGEQESQMKQTK